jgi:SlyX protein
MLEERLTNLEIRFSHQDYYLDQLNQIVTSQQQTIERLEKEILDLKRTANSNGVDGSRSPLNERPPHY